MKKHTVKRFIAINLCLLTIFSSALPAFAAASSEAESAEIDSSVASQADKQAQPETELQEDTAVPSDSDTEEPASEEPAADTEAVVPESSEVPSASAPAESVPANDVQPLYSDGRVTIDGVEYYYKDGKPASGWVGLGGTDWIYCESDGRILKDQWLELPTGGKWYLGSDGVNYTGWNQIEGGWYYMSGPARVQYGLRTIDGKKYYFDETTGKAVENSWVTVNGERLRTGEKGQIVDLSDGRVTMDGVEYYYKDGKPASGWVNVGHPNWIYCESDGRILKDQWLELPTGGKWYLGSDGVNYTGWNQIDGSWYYMSGPARVQYGLQTIDGQQYYFDEATGKAVENSWVTVNGERLRTGEKGLIVDFSDGRVTIDGVEYYYKGGKPASGWVNVGHPDWIYCESDGRILKNQWLELPTGGKWYLGSDGVNYTGWNKIEGSWYYMSGPARVQYGLQTIDGKKYYFDEKTGKAVENNWVTVNGKKLRTGEKGILVTGRLYVDGTEYYFQEGSPAVGWVDVGAPKWIYCDKDGQILKNQWLELPTGGKWYLGPDGINYMGWNKIDGSWYYMSGPARVQYGLQTIDGKKYYFDEKTGKAVENSWVTVDGKKLRTGEKGILVTGRLYVDGTEYYFQEGSPAVGWVDVGAPKWIYCDKDGRILKNQWLKLPTGGKWYLGPDGVNYMGWNQIDGSWYYMDGPARVQYGLRGVDGYAYIFDTAGRAMAGKTVTLGQTKVVLGEKGRVPDTVTGWIEYQGVRMYLTKGKYSSGWALVGKVWYCFNDKTGIQQVGWQERTQDGKIFRHYYKVNGAAVIGWYDEGGNSYYFETNGAAASGWKTINGKRYYFDLKTNSAYKGKWYHENGNSYYFETDGVAASGWKTIDGKQYYFDLKTNAAYKNKQVVIDGVTYKFDQNGVATKVDDFAGGVLAIDVSYHQGTIDWKKVAESGVEYAIIRSIGWNKAAGTVGGVDSMFDYNFREAKKYGIKVGTYIYTYASTTEKVIAEIEAFDAVMKKLAADGYTLDLPVFIDQEDDDLLALSYNQRTELLRLGMVLLDQKGYYPGMYMYSAWAKNNVNTEQLLAEGYDLWIADVRTSVQNPDWNGRCVMWQYSWEGSIPGIAGNVDMNKLYKDYSGIIHGSNNAGQEAVAKFKVYDQNSGRVVQDTMPRLLAAIVSNEVGGGLKLTGADRMKLYQAQAIAAHSWLLYSYGEGNEQPSVGLNYGGNFSLILSQIESVQDMILTYGGKPALTVYGSCGNGKTNASGDYWSTKLPYLVAGIESKYDQEWAAFYFGEENKYFPTTSYPRTSAKISEELKQKHNIDTSGYSDPSKWFVINKRNEGGYIVTLTICGKTIKGGTLNDNFSPILSADFTVEYNKATDIFTFKSNGNGHGIGMSQFGAAGYIAKEGWSYQQVLAHYYPGTTLTTVD